MKLLLISSARFGLKVSCVISLVVSGVSCGPMGISSDGNMTGISGTDDWQGFQSYSRPELFVRNECEDPAKVVEDWLAWEAEGLSEGWSFEADWYIEDSGPGYIYAKDGDERRSLEAKYEKRGEGWLLVDYHITDRMKRAEFIPDAMLLEMVWRVEDACGRGPRPQPNARAKGTVTMKANRFLLPAVFIVGLVVSSIPSSVVAALPDAQVVEPDTVFLKDGRVLSGDHGCRSREPGAHRRHKISDLNSR